MTAVGKQERQVIRSRIIAGLEWVRRKGRKLGRPTVGRQVEEAIRTQLGAGRGILKVARIVCCGSETVHRVKRGDDRSDGGGSLLLAVAVAAVGGCPVTLTGSA
jgi:DNA invertase Pin-like site-specific DNA recombinase